MSTDLNGLIANITVAPIGEYYAKGVMDYQNIESMKLQNLQRKLQYQEAVKQAAVDSLIRQQQYGQAKYDLEQQPTRQKRTTAKENMEFDVTTAENAVREMKGAAKSEAAYNTFLVNRLTNDLPIPEDLLDDKGKPLPWNAVKGEKLKNVYRKAVDSVEHLRNMEQEGEKRLTALASIPTSGVAATSGTQEEAGFKEFKSFEEETGFDYGSTNSKGSDASWFAKQLAELPNTIMRHYASKSGGGRAIAEATVRNDLRELAKKHTTTVGAYNPFKDDEALDREAFLRDVEALYQLESGKLGELGSLLDAPVNDVSVVEERTLPDGRVIQLLSDGTKKIK